MLRNGIRRQRHWFDGLEVQCAHQSVRVRNRVEAEEDVAPTLAGKDKRASAILAAMFRAQPIASPVLAAADPSWLVRAGDDVRFPDTNRV